jgi:hypothetical protein
MFLCLGLNFAHGAGENWQANWGIPPGYFLEVDTSGYRLPVAIAPVSNPGSRPDAPLYYVAELGGRILVVRNDRKVEVFADHFFELNLAAEMPDLSGVLGLTGLCLDAGTGYVFASYVYDGEGGRYNGITRFSTKPGEFSLTPGEVVNIRKPLMLGESNFTRLPYGHQIGQCQVIDGNLYVGIGDGEITYRAKSPTSLFGKVIRMQFDGSPVAASQFDPSAGKEPTVEDYIFASGLRNPFGQTMVGKNIVVADNGPGIDRVLTVRAGKDYLYDGSDSSIATNSMVVFTPAKGIANIAFYEQGSALGIDDLNNTVLVVLSGVPEAYVEDEPSEISAFGVEADIALVTSRPRSLVKYMGKQMQVMSSLAIGSDGIYFAPVYGENGVPGDSNVYRLSWAPEKTYPTVLGQYKNARGIMEKYGCRGCHKINGDGGNVGPALSAVDLRARNLARLNSPEYETLLAQMNSTSSADSAIAGRKRVLALHGEKRLAAWVEEKIKDPTFDNPQSVMPYFDILQDQAKILARFLLRETKPKPSAALKDAPAVPR